MTVHGAEPPVENAIRIEPGPGVAAATVRPVVFLLPGLAGEQDPELEKFWGPTRSELDLIPVTYFDWAEHVQTDCDFGALADHVQRQIETRLPEGPIRLAGYSLGGHLAFATALALEAKGRQVASLAILDAPIDFAALKGSAGKRLRARVKQVMRFHLRGGLASGLGKCLIMERSRPLLRYLAKHRDFLLPFHFERDLNHKLTMQLVRRIYGEWWRKTLREAAPLRAPWNLFRSQEHESWERQDLGWGGHCPHLRIIPVAGTHRGMLDPSINGPFRQAFVEVLTAPPD